MFFIGPMYLPYLPLYFHVPPVIAVVVGSVYTSVLLPSVNIPDDLVSPSLSPFFSRSGNGMELVKQSAEVGPRPMKLRYSAWQPQGLAVAMLLALGMQWGLLTTLLACALSLFHSLKGNSQAQEHQGFRFE